jgi:hypothetical protein
MKSMLLVSFLILSVNSFAADVYNESLNGLRRLNNGKCRLEHRALEYSHPELFVTFPMIEGEERSQADAGLVQAQGIDFETYKKILYSAEKVDMKTQKGAYLYTITALGNPQFARLIELRGTSTENSRRTNDLVISVLRNKVYTMTLVQTLAGRLWGETVTFSDTCQNLQ